MRCRKASLLAAIVVTSAAAMAQDEAASEPSVFSLGDHLRTRTLGGNQFWADELFFHGWRIQRNTISNHCRLLDERDIRHTSGTFAKCKARLEEIRVQRQLEPMSGKAVLLLHGLGRTRATMRPLADFLQKEGGYTTFRVGYPSTRRTIHEHAQALGRIIDGLEGVEEIHFVGHSLGAIVIRRYLAAGADPASDDNDPSSREIDPRIKRFVMLGPPNQGSRAAATFADNRLVGAFLGSPGKELGSQWVWLQAELATPQCEFAVIAGGLGNNRGINPILQGDNDGVVTVASARLDGADDFVLLPVLHSRLSSDPRAMESTLRFLQQGYLISENARQRIVGQ